MSSFWKDKVVIVTGASSGIGEAVSKLLGEKGARVVLAARRREKLEALSRTIPGSFPVELDVKDLRSVNRMAETVLKEFGHVDVLINNAGILLYKVMKDSELEEIRDLMETNFFGTVYCTRAVLPAMQKEGTGWIVNIASIAGRVGFPMLGYYAASKFAVVGFSETLRQELAHEGIGVTTVCPGTFYTPLNEKIIDAARAKGKKVSAPLPGVLAAKILDAVEKRKGELYAPFFTKMLYLVHFIFPRFVEWLAWKFRSADPENLRN